MQLQHLAERLQEEQEARFLLQHEVNTSVKLLRDELKAVLEKQMS